MIQLIHQLNQQYRHNIRLKLYEQQKMVFVSGRREPEFWSGISKK
jgi:hypothetical protein